MKILSVSVNSGCASFQVTHPEIGRGLGRPLWFLGRRNCMRYLKAGTFEGPFCGKAKGHIVWRRQTLNRDTALEYVSWWCCSDSGSFEKKKKTLHDLISMHPAPQKPEVKEFFHWLPLTFHILQNITPWRAPSLLSLMLLLLLLLPLIWFLNEAKGRNF